MIYRNLFFFYVVVLLCCKSFAGDISLPEIQTISKPSWCMNGNILTCMNEKIGDVYVYNNPDGHSYPKNMGLYGVISRAAPHNTEKLWGLPIEKQITDDGSIYVMKKPVQGLASSADMLTSLNLFAEEVLQTFPKNNPVGYLFMQKVIEGSLYSAAIQDNKDIYSQIERFRNCVQISIMTNDITTLQSKCALELKANE